jgi:16S rRNA C1402 (ribose-2'-O) methylase RsmI
VVYVAWVEPLIIGLLSVGLILETIFLFGCLGLVAESERKFNLLLSNYKADLEMVMLHAHRFDEFIKQTEAAMKEDEESEKKKPVDTYYIG